jgi:hypothetical protein
MVQAACSAVGKSIQPAIEASIVFLSAAKGIFIIESSGVFREMRDIAPWPKLVCQPRGTTLESLNFQSLRGIKTAANPYAAGEVTLICSPFS